MEAQVTQQDYDKAMQALQTSALQTGQATDANSMYADYMRETKVGNILGQLNPDALLEDIEHRIRGEKKNRYTQVWEIINKEAETISEELIGNYVSFLGSVLNQNTSLSNFSAQEINNIMEAIIEYISCDLTDNDKKYGIVGNYNEMSRIGNIICLTTFAVLKRAMNGKEAQRVFASLKVTESLTPQPQKKGMLDFLKFWE